MTPIAGVNVPANALNTPPVPVVRVHAPPACSPVIKVNKLITATLFSQIVVPPSFPAVGCGLIIIVAKLVSLIHGAVPVKVYVKVEVVAPTAGV